MPRSYMWLLPSEGWVKADIYVAYNSKLKAEAIIVIFRDHDGYLIVGLAWKIRMDSPLMAKTIILIDALLLFQSFNLNRIILKSDNKELIVAYKGDLKRNWSIHMICMILMFYVLNWRRSPLDEYQGNAKRLLI